MQAGPAQRRAVGLARALQAGALSAVTLPAPRDLMGYKPVLAAHAALAGGRHAAAGVLREVLRELYPAALRAYPDPAAPVALAVLDALPEPGMLAAGNGAGRSIPVAVDAVAAHLAGDGVADAEVDRRGGHRAADRDRRDAPPRGRQPGLTSAVAETVRQAVAAVRACDAGCEALVGALSRRARRAAEPSAPLAPSALPSSAPTSGPMGPAALRSHPGAVGPLRARHRRAPCPAPRHAVPSAGRGRAAPARSGPPVRWAAQPSRAGLRGAADAPAPMSAPPATSRPVSAPPQVPAPRSAGAGLRTVAFRRRAPARLLRGRTRSW